MKDIVMKNASTDSKTTIATIASNSTNTVDSLLKNIITKHDAWNAGSKKASTQELYSVLAECLELMTTVKVQKGFDALNLRLFELDVKFNESTSLQTRIVRAVFKHDSRNLGRYAAIIKIASQHAIYSEGFVAWLNEKGGIDAARRFYAKPKAVTISNDELYKAATDHLRGASTLATVNGKMLANVSDTPTSGYVVSIARINAAGDFEVVGASTDATAVRKAMISWGQHVISTNQSIAIDENAKASNQKLAAAIAA